MRYLALALLALATAVFLYAVVRIRRRRLPECGSEYLARMHEARRERALAHQHVTHDAVTPSRRIAKKRSCTAWRRRGW